MAGTEVSGNELQMFLKPEIYWCPGRELNPHTRCRITDFKSVASASFATRAHFESKQLTKLPHIAPGRCGGICGESAQIHRRHALIRQLNRLRGRMNVPLRNRDCGMPHQPHYSEGVRPRLSRTRPERMPERMQHEVRRHFEERPHPRMLLPDVAIWPRPSVGAVEYVALRCGPVIPDHVHAPLAERHVAGLLALCLSGGDCQNSEISRLAPVPVLPEPIRDSTPRRAAVRYREAAAPRHPRDLDRQRSTPSPESAS